MSLSIEMIVDESASEYLEEEGLLDGVKAQYVV
jgi:hypothetical protein